MEPKIILECNCFLGESPYWHKGSNSFFWVDIEGGILYKYHMTTKNTKHWKFNHKLSLVIEGENDNLILEANGANSEIFFKQKNNEIYKLSDFLSVAKELDIIVKQQEITMQEQENTINSLIARIEKLENR